jgi:hypothetical protein
VPERIQLVATSSFGNSKIIIPACAHARIARWAMQATGQAMRTCRCDALQVVNGGQGDGFSEEQVLEALTPNSGSRAQAVALANTFPSYLAV